MFPCWKQPLCSKGHGLEKQRSIETAEEPTTESEELVREAVPDPISSSTTVALSGEENNVGKAGCSGKEED